MKRLPHREKYPGAAAFIAIMAVGTFSFNGIIKRNSGERKSGLMEET